MPAPRGASDDLNLRMQGAPSSNGCRLLGRGLHECPRQPSFDIARPAADNKLFFFNTEAVVRRLRSLDISSATVFMPLQFVVTPQARREPIQGCSHATRLNSPRDPSSCSNDVTLAAVTLVVLAVIIGVVACFGDRDYRHVVSAMPNV